jgi:hypothetical protein
MDTREQSLYEAAGGNSITDEFLKNWVSTSELVTLGLSMGVRRLILLLVERETDPKDIIAATKLLAILSGKDEIGVTEETIGRPTGSAGDAELLEAISRTRSTAERK